MTGTTPHASERSPVAWPGGAFPARAGREPRALRAPDRSDSRLRLLLGQHRSRPRLSACRLLAALLVIGLCLSGCSVLPPARTVSTALASHDYVLAGEGEPSVILEAGLGDGKEAWSPIFLGIAERTRVFAYDRAGYGDSRGAEPTRDGPTLIRELRESLRELGLEPPYVLAGHSLGGTYMELYARTYPDEVAGLVLIDARHAEFTDRCLAAGARFCEPPPLLTALLPSAAKRELSGAAATSAALAGAGRAPDVPLVVLTGMNKPLEGERFRNVWMQTQRELALLTPRAHHDVCMSCGHYVHRDDPGRVIAAIASVLDAVGQQQAGAE